MKAKIVENLMDIIDDFFEGSEGHRTDPDFIKLCDRIAGEEVDLVFTDYEAFEKIDNTYWLPNCCWTEVQ